MELDLADDSAAVVAPQEMSEETKTAMMESAMRRLCAAGMEGASPLIWSPLVVRLITRGLCNTTEGEEENELAEGRREALRQIVFDFVIADLQSRFVSRDTLDMTILISLIQDGFRAVVVERGVVCREIEFESRKGTPLLLFPRASLTRHCQQERPYDRWLRRLLEHILSYSSNKDKAFSQFMVDLPEIPVEEVVRLGEMCKNPEQSVQELLVARRRLTILAQITTWLLCAQRVDFAASTGATGGSRCAAVSDSQSWFVISFSASERNADERI